MNWNTLFLLQAQGEGKSFGSGGWEMILFIGLIIVVFYFFMIRPQQKKQKQMQNFRDSLKKGDKIVTIGGIHAKIVNIEETTFTIEVEDGGKLKIDKAAVAIDANELSKKNKEEK